MTRNHINDQWVQLYWKAWREIRVRWNQERKTSEVHSQDSLGATDSVRVSEFAGFVRLSFPHGARCNLTAFGSWSGGSFVRPFFPPFFPRNQVQADLRPIHGARVPRQRTV